MSYLRIPASVERGMQIINPAPMNAVFSYSTEADIRDAISAVAWLQGYEIQTELHVPGVGRADLVVSTPRGRAVVEFKRSISTLSAARAAFQQADSYRRFIAGCDAAIVSAVEPPERDVHYRVERAYELVDYQPAGALVGQHLDIYGIGMPDLDVGAYRRSVVERMASAATHMRTVVAYALERDLVEAGAA